MKTKTIVIVTLVSLAVLLLAVSPVSAATRTIQLLSAKLEAGKNAAVFEFRVYGDFGKFSGFVYANGMESKLNCNLQAKFPDILICRMATGIPGLA